jgi:hypothetical protein
MKHPKNKRERFDISFNKGKKRNNNDFGLSGDNDWSKQTIDNLQKKRRNCTVGCSCYGCGNPRKYFKDKTIQEKKFDESYERSD